MQEPDTNSQMKSKNFNETVWQSRKDRQQTEKEIELLLNRLQLLKKEETLIGKKIDQTRKRTQEVVDKKLMCQLSSNMKTNTKKDDELKLKETQTRNYELKKKREQDREMIREAMKQIKKEEHDELKRLKLENKLKIHDESKLLQEKNRERKQEIRTLMQQSRSNINLYWQSKIERIQKEHEQLGIENLQAQRKNEGIIGRLEEEEMSLIAKLQRSQDLHEQLGRRLERAINLPHDEFRKMHDSDRDIMFMSQTQNNNNSRIAKLTFRSDPQLSIIKDKLNSYNIPEVDEPDRSWLPLPVGEEPIATEQ